MPAATASQVLDRDFLQIRARLLEVAAYLDRLDRGPGSVSDDPRMQSIRKALAALTAASSGRAEQVQLIFSRSYEPQWKAVLQMPSR